MSKFIVQGGGPLKGSVRIGGAKNSVLPIIAACLLTKGKNVIEDVPNFEDVKVICELMQYLGATTKREGNSLTIEINSINNLSAPYELVSKMRASFLVMGPLLAVNGCTKISMPGGCAIGTRPVDLHLKGFAAMGAEIDQSHGYIEAKATKLKGAKIYLDFPSVGATENLIMAATLAEGLTILENAATEPEIVDLVNFLTSCGADIKGAGTDTIKITGVSELKAAVHTVIPDRIEAGTFMVASAITKGDVTVENVIPAHLKSITAKLKEIGVTVIENGNKVRVMVEDGLKAVDLKTLPYPGFPTDMQAQMTALMSICEGSSIIIETIFENRFMHVSELNRMGANIRIDGRSAFIEGGAKLNGAQVQATDLRAGAALILAGLVADGKTEVLDAHHIERGYDNLDEKLRGLGAKIIKEN